MLGPPFHALFAHVQTTWLQWILVLMCVYGIPFLLGIVFMVILLAMIMDGYSDVKAKAVFAGDKANFFSETVEISLAWTIVRTPLPPHKFAAGRKLKANYGLVPSRYVVPTPTYK